MITKEQEDKLRAAAQIVIDRYIATGRRVILPDDITASGLSGDDFEKFMRYFFDYADAQLLMGNHTTKPLGVIDLDR